MLASPDISTPLGPIRDGVLVWPTWITLTGLLGVLVAIGAVAGPTAAKLDPQLRVRVTTRLARLAVVLGVLFVPAFFVNLAHASSAGGLGFDYHAAWDTLFRDEPGSIAGTMLGLEIVLAVLAVVAVAPLTSRRVAAGRWRPWSVATGAALAALALICTKLPTEQPDDWDREMFETVVWIGHLLGGGVWIGGLFALVALGVPGVLPDEHRGAFWGTAIRRFSLLATGCVAAVVLSGLWLYWLHVDGLSQLISTMYGTVLGVKIIIVATILLLGAVNQFWLHPRILAARAAGDDRPLPALLLRRFTVAVSAEALLGASVLMVAPFLHGSARKQAFQQAYADAHPGVAVADLPKAPDKVISASTWAYGVTETCLLVALLIAGLLVSGRIARRRLTAVIPDVPDPDDMLELSSASR